ncbi:probable acyl-CoA dehydrogenase 6 [Apostichopus japonicus]|uniref:probable acyl-CoA dehydrogenase 6 n=1 Tax=Stichopus japonicus TaxID=307972 RepID=UPI003AB7DEDA
MLTSRISQSCRVTSQNVFRRFQSAQARLAESSIESMREENIFTEEHIALRQSLRKIIENEINPHVEQWENEKMFPAHRVMKILGSNGFLGVNKPVEYGGLGLDFSYSIAVAEELGNIDCGGIPMAIGVQTDMATPALARFGSDELRKHFLAPTISGDYVACLGVSEPGAGSDVANITTTAVKDGDDFIINGAKMWITSGTQADWMCLLANTGGEKAFFNKSLICLPLDTKGVDRTTKIEKIGMHSSDTAQVFFEDVRIPQKYLIGDEGQGFTYQMLQFQEERLFGVASVLLGLEKCIAYTIDYCRERKIFGKPILDNQVVHFRMAELATEIELLRSVLYRTVGKFLDGQDVTKRASMAKLKGGRLCREVSDSCLQYLGGSGFTHNPVSRTFRDGRLGSIGGGADEVMLSIICKYMGTLPGRKK